MATGTIKYWNGREGWIMQTGLSASATTRESNDRIFRYPADVSSGTPALGASVTFTQASGGPPSLGQEALAGSVVVS
jgi:hypothetical protein